MEIPEVHWSDIGGETELKNQIKESVEWPINKREIFERMKIESPKGILLYGPPGCSKTLMAKAIATETKMNFISIKGPELLSKWVGESEKSIKEIFRKARVASPCIIFFDEIDSLTMKRSSASSDSSSGVNNRILSQLLIEMDGINSKNEIIVIAATNRPDMIDNALLRPGRFDRLLYVKLPDLETRIEIFKIYSKKSQNVCLSDEDYNELGDISEGYSGAEIESVCREACLIRLENDINNVKLDINDYKKAMERIKKQTSEEMLRYYANIQGRSFC